jgi:hypothetical protein
LIIFSFFLSDTLDDNSQTVVTTDHSRTPSPQKPISTPTISMTKNTQLPIYSCIPSSDPTKAPPIQPTPTSSLNIFAPKPFRSNIDPPNNPESVGIHFLSSLNSFFLLSIIQDMTFSRKELLTLMVISYFLLNA